MDSNPMAVENINTPVAIRIIRGISLSGENRELRAIVWFHKNLPR